MAVRSGRELQWMCCGLAAAIRNCANITGTSHADPRTSDVQVVELQAAGQCECKGEVCM